MSDLAHRLDAAHDRLRDEHPPAPRFLTVVEVAQLARCEHKAVRRAIHDGRLEAFTTNRKLVIREADAVRWIESRPVRPPSRSPRPARRRVAVSSVEQLRAMDPELSSPSRP